MKIILGAAIIVAALALGPVGFTSMILITSAIETSLIVAGASLALQGIAGALTKGSLGTSVALKQAAAPRSMTYGRTRTGGVILYMSESGDSDKYQHIVVLHASCPCVAVQALYLDGNLVVFSGTNVYDDGNDHYNDSGVKYNFQGRVRFESRMGNITNTPFTFLTAQDPNWPLTATCDGCCVSYIRLSYDAKTFPNGMPGIRVDLQGKTGIYDPRTGTHVYTENPALCIADILCDVSGFGLQCNYANEIDEPALIAAANLCDERVYLADESSEPRYSCNGNITSDMAPGEILSMLLSSCAGRMSCVNGKWQIHPGAWVAPSLSLSDKDLMAPIKWLPNRKYRDKCNGVRATFICPTFPYLSYGAGLPFGQKQTGIFDGMWRETDVPPYLQDVTHGYSSDANYTADLNTRLWMEMKFPFTISVATAQRLMKIALLKNRQQGSGTLSCSLAAYQALPLDVIQFSHPRFGWTNKNLEVVAERLTYVNAEGDRPPSLGLELDVVESDPSVYAWSTSEELRIDDALPPRTFNMGNVGMPSGLTLESDASTQLASADGIKRTRIKVTWTAPNDGYVTHGGHIEMQSRITGGATWNPWAQFDGATTSAYIDGVSDGVSYDVQIRSANVSGAYSNWEQATITAGVSISNLTAVSIEVDGTILV